MRGRGAKRPARPPMAEGVGRFDEPRPGSATGSLPSSARTRSEIFRLDWARARRPFDRHGRLLLSLTIRRVPLVGLSSNDRARAPREGAQGLFPPSCTSSCDVSHREGTTFGKRQPGVKPKPRGKREPERPERLVDARDNWSLPMTSSQRDARGLPSRIPSTKERVVSNPFFFCWSPCTTSASWIRMLCPSHKESISNALSLWPHLFDNKVFVDQRNAC